MCFSAERQLLFLAVGRAEHPRSVTRPLQVPGLRSERGIGALCCCERKGICSTDKSILSPSTFFSPFCSCGWLFVSSSPLSSVLIFTFSCSGWLQLRSLTDGWFHLATSGSPSPSKFLPQVVVRARLLVSAVCAKA